MTSCLFKNPSPATLMACSIFGAGLSLVGVPVAVYHSYPFLRNKYREHQRKKHQGLYYHQPIVKDTSPREKLDDKIEGMMGVAALGSVLTIGSSASMVFSTKSFIKKFRSSPLIQNVCCNRIRFFAIIALLEGMNLGCFVVGSFCLIDGSIELLDLRKQRSSLIKNQ